MWRMGGSSGRNSRGRGWKLREDADEVIDLNGAVLMPGFIDAHSHFVGAANAMTQCDLSLCKDFGEIIELMKAFKEKRNLPGGCMDHRM